MKLIYSIIAFLSLMLLPQLSMAQSATENLMRSNGRIYVVVAVLLIILFGVFFYLFSIDRKITKLENEQKM